MIGTKIILQKGMIKMSKILVSFFSASGLTKDVASKIANVIEDQR